MAREAAFKSSVYWDKGHTPLIVKKRLEQVFVQDLPDILDKALDTIGNKTLEKLQSIHRTAFPVRTSHIPNSTSYRSIIKFGRPVTVEIFPGAISKVNRYHIGYYPNYFPAARQLAPKHDVYTYMKYLNDGIRKGMVVAPSPGNTGTKGVMSRAGWDRLRVWTNEMGLVQSSRPYTVKRLRKRKEGTVGRPSKFRTYGRKEEEEKTYMANTTRQIWMMIKGMEKRGIPRRAMGRGLHHLFNFESYIHTGMGIDIQEAIGEAFRSFKRVSGKRGTEISVPVLMRESR